MIFPCKVYARKLGDDVRGAINDVVGSAWLTAVLLNRITRWVGQEGAESKSFLGGGYTEWLRILSTEDGMLFGSPIRALSSTVNSSPQSPAWRDLTAGTVALGELAALAVRRGASASWADWCYKHVMGFWG